MSDRPSMLDDVYAALITLDPATPVLARIEVSTASLEGLRRALPRPTSLARVDPWAVPLHLADDVPDGSARFVYSDGTTVTKPSQAETEGGR